MPGDGNRDDVPRPRLVGNYLGQDRLDRGRGRQALLNSAATLRDCSADGGRFSRGVRAGHKAEFGPQLSGRPGSPNPSSCGPSLMSSACTDRPGRAADGLVAPRGAGPVCPADPGTVSGDCGKGARPRWDGLGGCASLVSRRLSWLLSHLWDPRAQRVGAGPHPMGLVRTGGVASILAGVVMGVHEWMRTTGCSSPGRSTGSDSGGTTTSRPRRCSARPGCSPCPDRSRSPASMSPTAHAAVPHQPPALRGNVIQTLPQRAGRRLSAVLT